MRQAFVALGAGALLFGAGHLPAARAAPQSGETAEQHERQTTDEVRELRRFMARSFIYCRLADIAANRSYYSAVFSLDGARNAAQRMADYSLAFRGTVLSRFVGAQGDAGCSTDEDILSLRKHLHDDQYQDVIQRNEVRLTGWSPAGSRLQAW